MRRVALLLGALLLVPALAIPASAQMAGSFADVPVDHWAYDAVQSLADAGIIEGYPDYTYKGQRAMSRYEMAMMIARVKEYIDKEIAAIETPSLAGYATEAWVKEQIAKIAPPEEGPTIDQIREQLKDQLLTPEQKALLRRLETEFAPELRRINNTLADLDDRLVEVEDWIANAPPPAKITLSGDIRWRFGMYGDSLKLTDDVEPYPVSVPDWDDVEGVLRDSLAWEWWLDPDDPDDAALLDMLVDEASIQDWMDAVVNAVDFGWYPFIFAGMKDAYKAPKFSSTRIRLIASGDVSDNVGVKLVLFADPRSNITAPGYFSTDDPHGVNPISPNSLYSDGLMANARFDEAYATFKTSAIVPLEATVGRQYFKYGMGLLVDNCIQSFNAVKVKWGEPTGWNLTGVGGLFEREAFDGQGADLFGPIGQDGYHAWRVSIPFGGYTTVGLNWLGSGFGGEKGWSADVSGKIAGVGCSLEYAKLDADAGSADIPDEDTAYVASLDLIDSEAVKLNAKYGMVEPLYAITPSGGWSQLPMINALPIFNLPFSALHPYASVAADYIDWVDRPLFLSPSNVSKGWELMVGLPNLLGANSPLTVRYYDGKAYNPGWFTGASSDKWRDADRVWTVALTRNIANNVDWTVLYGRREVANVLQPDPDDVQDDLQVLRTEVMIRF